MKNSLLKKTLSIVVSLSLVMAFSLPATALAADNDVDVANNHAAAGAAKAVSDITIDGVSLKMVSRYSDGFETII